MAKTPAAGDKKPAARRRAPGKPVAAKAAANAVAPEQIAKVATIRDDLRAIAGDVNRIAATIAPEKEKGADKHREPPPFDEPLPRIKEIVSNARALWLVLLGALVFAAITLASIKDVAFFVPTVETKLPLVDISVPVEYFFYAGAPLIAALYAYFHLYLERLWFELGKIEPQLEYRTKNEPEKTKFAKIADRVEPWIVVDAALRRRDQLQWIKDENKRAAPRRMMPLVGDIVLYSLVWLFGLAVIGWFWWRSMPAHEPLLTGWLALVFAFTLWVYFKSRHRARDHLRDTKTPEKWRKWFPVMFAAIAGLTVVRTSWDPWAGQRRETIFQYQVEDDHFEARIDFLRPARANLAEVEFTEKPKEWQGKEIMEAEFRLRWCKEHSVLKAEDCGSALDAADPIFRDEKMEGDFQEAWGLRWRIFLASLPKPDLRGKDFRGANLSAASLEGANLSNARLEGANLFNASLEGANLSNARLEGADLNDASLEGANLNSARLDGADLNNARLEGAKLIDARLEGANLSFARLEGADLFRARLEGANLSEASLEGAKLSFARLLGKPGEPLDLTAIASLSASLWTSSALRDADLEGVNMADLREFEKSFGDGSVVLPDGMPRPPGWCAAVLSDSEYFGRWRGFLDPKGDKEYDDYFNNFPAIPRSVPCPSKRRDE